MFFTRVQLWTDCSPASKLDDVCVFCRHGGFHFCEVLLPPSSQELLRGGSSSPHVQGLTLAFNIKGWMNIGVAALQTWIVSTQQHIFQIEILAHLVIQAWLHGFSPPCCFSPNLPQLL